MSLYLVIVWLLVPPTHAGAQPLQLELHREYVSASTAQVCKLVARQRADEQRAVNAEQVQRMKALVVGTCTLQTPPPQPGAMT